MGANSSLVAEDVWSPEVKDLALEMTAILLPVLLEDDGPMPSHTSSLSGNQYYLDTITSKKLLVCPSKLLFEWPSGCPWCLHASR